ncbi:MAG: HAD family hydrolase [Bacteroidota bacterium]|nr:HAD family hydrolase [Bacteroidota bacterium]
MKQKAIFIDRDGVINREIGRYVTNIDDFVLNPGILQGLKKLKAAGWLLIMITNQGGIAKGLYTKDKVDCLHGLITEQLSRLKINFDAIYICPHHNEIEKCLCRKPNSLLLEKAIARFNIDTNQSVMIGDSDRDMLAAERVGVRGIKVNPNENFLKTIAEFL